MSQSQTLKSDKKKPPSGRSVPIDVEQGRPEGERSKARSIDDDYPNYRPHFCLILVHLVIFCILAALIFLTPSAGTGIIKIESSQTFLGVMQTCIGDACEGWMATGAPVATNGGTTPTATPSTTTGGTAERRHQLDIRAEGDTLATIVPPANLFLTTGLASLAAFYLSFYSLFFLFIRRFFIIPRFMTGADDDDGNGRRRKLDSIKLFVYRASLFLVFFEFWVVLGVAGQSTLFALKVRSSLKLSGTDGAGGGLAALHVAWILLLYCWTVEWAAPKGKIRRILTPRWLTGTCAMLGCFACCCGADSSIADSHSSTESQTPQRKKKKKKASPTGHRIDTGSREGTPVPPYSREQPAPQGGLEEAARSRRKNTGPAS